MHIRYEAHAGDDVAHRNAGADLPLVLLSDDRRATDQLHYVYGSLALGAVLTPWFYAPVEPRRRLGWFAACSALAAALAVRAFMTGS